MLIIHSDPNVKNLQSKALINQLSYLTLFFNYCDLTYFKSVFWQNSPTVRCSCFTFTRRQKVKQTIVCLTPVFVFQVRITSFCNY